jgi:hypothetical protein
MKRMLMAIAALGLAAVSVRSDWGGPVVPAPQQGGPSLPSIPQLAGPNTLLGMGAPSSGAAPDQYGLHPRLKKLFRMGTYKEPAQVPPSYYYPYMGYNQGGPAYNPTGYPIGSAGPAQGTLVFPNSPFTRSPRDYFMPDVNK